MSWCLGVVGEGGRMGFEVQFLSTSFGPVFLTAKVRQATAT